MGKKTKKTINFKGIVLFVAMLLIGALFGVLISSLTISKSIPIWWMFVSIFLSLFIIINIHEFGHFIIGKCLGYKLISYRISIFSFDFENGKMKLSIKKNKGYGGLCAMMPYDDSMNKMAWYISGGILMNLLTGVLFILLGVLVPNMNDYLSSFFVAMGVISIFMFILNGIPLTKNNVVTDGTFLYNIILKKPYAKTLALLITSQTAVATGTRPRELDIIINKDEEFNLPICLFAYYKAQDMQDTEKANELVNKLESNFHMTNAITAPGVCYEICYCACINGDIDKAKKYYNKCKKTITKDKDSNGMRAKAYYEYYINNDIDKAKKYCKQGLAVIDKYPIKGIALYEKDLLLKLQEKLSTL